MSRPIAQQPPEIPALIAEELLKVPLWQMRSGSRQRDPRWFLHAPATRGVEASRLRLDDLHTLGEYKDYTFVMRCAQCGWARIYDPCEPLDEVGHCGHFTTPEGDGSKLYLLEDHWILSESAA